MSINAIFCISKKLELLRQANKNLRSFPHNFLSQSKQKTDMTYPCDMMCPYWDSRGWVFGWVWVKYLNLGNVGAYKLCTECTQCLKCHSNTQTQRTSPLYALLSNARLWCEWKLLTQTQGTFPLSMHCWGMLVCDVNVNYKLKLRECSPPSFL